MKPLLIVLTPVRNEAWVLHAFLKATSLWADYIIVADQMSTDGSRDIYPQYEKVIVVDNPRQEMHQARTRKLLFAEAQKIHGDKILFTLDADEFLSGDFINTPSWKLILNSIPNDIFCFSWINLLNDPSQHTVQIPFHWASHIDNDMESGTFPDNQIHEYRLPYPRKVTHEYVIKDISFIHVANLNKIRQYNKQRFYQVSTAFHCEKYSGIRLYRTYYSYPQNTMVFSTPDGIYDYYLSRGLDILKEINLEDEGKHYVDNMLSNIQERGINHFKKINIWDRSFCEKYNLKDPRSWFDKLIFLYLRLTSKYSKTFLVRGIDKILKKLY